MTPQTPLPPAARAGRLDLSVRRDLQEPDGGPPEGYPYKDEPVPDAAKREYLNTRILGTLHTRFDQRSDVMLSGDVFIYYRDEDDRRRALAPDVVAIFGPDFAQYRNRYGLSLAEMGKPPDFVMEIASPSTRRADLTYKRDTYHWMGAGELWLCDPEGGRYYGQPLYWEQLGDDDEYHRMPVHTDDDGVIWAHSPALGLDVCMDGDRIRFYDPVAGEYLLDQHEEKAAREAAEALLTAEQVAREIAESVLAREQTARQTAESALAQEQAARAAEQTARQTAESALAQEQAARAAAEEEIRQLRAQLQSRREAGGAPPA